MNTRWIPNQTRFPLLLLAGILTVTASAARAQDVPSPGGDNGNYNGSGTSQDPPTRVARLSYVEGSVSFQPSGQGDWAAATRNRPVTIGDKIWSDNNSRAELQAGQASIHLGNMTALSFLNLDEQTTQMRLAEGTINFRVRELREGEVYEVDTPNVAFNVTQAGAFRVDVNENGDGTRITAIRGEGQVTANGQTYTIHAGERGEFNGTDSVTYFIAAAPAPDEFDRWSNNRDLKEDNSVSARYVSRDVPGYSDLDDYGTWDDVPEYGHVWYPAAVDVGWAPYSYGYWNYVGPWGWTWVDYAPWGFAPFHYGRWASIGGRWGWCPGSIFAPPIYGPAFVGFVGGGFGFGVGVGWFPLGFGEPFFPWFHCSPRFVNIINVRNTTIVNVNVVNSRNINNFNFVNAHNPAAVTVASRSAFVNGQPINRGATRVTAASLRNTSVTNNPGFSPTRQSFVGAAATRGNIARPSAAVQNRPVMARTSPAPAASHMPVRAVSGANNQQGRAGFSSGNAVGSHAPITGRTAETAAAANNNRPSFSRGTQGNAQHGGIRPGNDMRNSPPMSARQRELLLDKPQSHMRNAPTNPGTNGGVRGQANAGGTRNWAAQGNSTDRGRAPAGFGSNTMRPDRPPTASSSRSGNSGYTVSPRSSAFSDRPNNSNPSRGNVRSYAPPQRNSTYSNDRPSNNSNGGYSQPRSYSSPSYSQPRNYSAPRSYSAPSAPSRSYSAPQYSQPRSYSAPSPSYSAPSHSYSAPSYSSGGGGGSRGGGGSQRDGGGSSSHASSSPHGRG